MKREQDKVKIRIILDTLLKDGSDLLYFNGCTQTRVDGIIDVFSPSGKTFNIITKEWFDTGIDDLESHVIRQLKTTKYLNLGK